MVIQQSGDLHLQGRAGRVQGAAWLSMLAAAMRPLPPNNSLPCGLQRLSDVHGGGAGAGDLQRALGVAQRLRN
uniref:hypothetical protein n=1 Tax=Xanthomonas oryzae TaxID=347 RepID=UPI003DA05709